MYKEIAIGFIIVLVFVFGILPIVFNVCFGMKKEPEDENWEFDGDYINSMKVKDAELVCENENNN